jgi:hypothetical protein
MSTSSQPYRVYSEGQIALEQAMFCLECELIFAGTTRCPRCNEAAVWPLTQWLPPLRPSLAGIPVPERDAYSRPPAQILPAVPGESARPVRLRVLEGGSAGNMKSA